MSEVSLYRGSLFALAEFRCAPGDERWRSENVIGPRPVAAFPLTSVVIRHAGHDAALANANHVVFYRGRERYRRELHDPRGDRCLFVAFEPAFAAALLAAHGLGGDEIPVAYGPSPARSYLRLRVAAQAFANGHGEALAVEEAVCDALGSAVDAAAEVNGTPRATRRGTETRRGRLVEDAKLVLTERAVAHDSLAALAQRLHTSEFHLARVFRARTGFTLHGYRTQLRLRAALERLAQPSGDLSALAAELGFNSHSHFTGAFRATFGVPPSIVRESCGRRARSELRRILEAEPTAAL